MPSIVHGGGGGRRGGVAFSGHCDRPLLILFIMLLALSLSDAMRAPESDNDGRNVLCG